YNTYQFNAIALDQFANRMATQPTITWSMNGAGAMNYYTGVYQAPTAGNQGATVTATAGSVTGTSTVAIGSNSGAYSVPGAPSFVSAYAEDGTNILIGWKSGDSSADGFLIEASSDGGSTYNPIHLVGPADTSYLATGL